MVEDKRVIKTKALIRNAYLQAIKEFGMRKVTVVDVCERAFISRRTFYSHYETIDYLFYEIMDDCCAYMNQGVAYPIVSFRESDYGEVAANREEALKTIKGFLQASVNNLSELKVFLLHDNPEFEHYLKMRLRKSLLQGKNANFKQTLAYEIILSERYEILKYLILHPDTPLEELSEFLLELWNSYVHVMFRSGLENQSFGD